MMHVICHAQFDRLPLTATCSLQNKYQLWWHWSCSIASVCKGPSRCHYEIAAQPLGTGSGWYSWVLSASISFSQSRGDPDCARSGFFFCSTGGLLLTECPTVFLQANVPSVEENFISYAYLHILVYIYLKLQSQGNLYDGTHLHFLFLYLYRIRQNRKVSASHETF